MIRNNNEKIKFLKYIKHMTIDIDSKSINTILDESIKDQKKINYIKNSFNNYLLNSDINNCYSIVNDLFLSQINLSDISNLYILDNIIEIKNSKNSTYNVYFGKNLKLYHPILQNTYSIINNHFIKKCYNDIKNTDNIYIYESDNEFSYFYKENDNVDNKNCIYIFNYYKNNCMPKNDIGKIIIKSFIDKLAINSYKSDEDSIILNFNNKKIYICGKNNKLRYKELTDKAMDKLIDCKTNKKGNILKKVKNNEQNNNGKTN